MPSTTLETRRKGSVMFRNKYRIVRDEYAGFAVEVRRWWFPIWLRDGINTHISERQAEEYAKRRANYVVRELGAL